MKVSLKDPSVYRTYDFKLKATLVGTSEEEIEADLQLKHECIIINSALFKTQTGPIDLSSFFQGTNNAKFNYEYTIDGLSIEVSSRCPIAAIKRYQLSVVPHSFEFSPDVSIWDEKCNTQTSACAIVKIPHKLGKTEFYV